MAGKPKRGISYAGWNVDIFENDTKIDELIDAQGWIGFSIYFYLCQRAYGSEGYFYRWSYANAATTARRMGGGIGSETVKQTVATCLRIGLFHDRPFEEDGVLTSRGIQRRYVDAIQKRSCKSVIHKYWLLGAKESQGLVFVSEDGDVLPEDGDVLPEDDAKTKVDEIKGKKRKQRSRAELPSTSTPEAPESPVVISLILNDGTTYDVSQLEVDKYTQLYPAVNMLQALRSMAGWLDGNPTRRKTRSGIKRFINSWLARDQNRGGSQGVVRDRNQYVPTPPLDDDVNPFSRRP
ncbi:MAG: DUF4373 domain-containing protein [Alphaproteobacteria bacterium]|nr:DUF4373 domain-containing protein [Alphaproteobacteria bacterium]